MKTKRTNKLLVLAEDGSTEWLLDLNEPHKSGNVAIKVN